MTNVPRSADMIILFDVQVLANTITISVICLFVRSFVRSLFFVDFFLFRIFLNRILLWLLACFCFQHRNVVGNDSETQNRKAKGVQSGGMLSVLER